MPFTSNHCWERSRWKRPTLLHDKRNDHTTKRTNLCRQPSLHQTDGGGRERDGGGIRKWNDNNFTGRHTSIPPTSLTYRLCVKGRCTPRVTGTNASMIKHSTSARSDAKNQNNNNNNNKNPPQIKQKENKQKCTLEGEKGSSLSSSSLCNLVKRT